MLDIALYPLKFQPIIKDKIWGGDKLKVRLGKNAGEYSGESWEISGVEGNQSIVANGEFKGKHLNELIDIFKEKFLGSSTFEKFGKEFPVLIKFNPQLLIRIKRKFLISAIPFYTSGNSSTHHL